MLESLEDSRTLPLFDLVMGNQPGRGVIEDPDEELIHHSDLGVQYNGLRYQQGKSQLVDRDVV